jgi:chromosome segregation ATPase
VQYLAEVKKTSGMLGARAEVKLLARNTSENNWQAINNEETISLQDANQARDLKDGQLVLADVSNAKQVQSLQDASKRIVLILQNFSRLEGKYKQGEEDIEQWKQSLNYQSQELHRREIELEQKEQEFENLEARKQEVETSHEDLKRERDEFEKWRQEFELEKNKFTSQATSLDREQAGHLRDLAKKILASLFNPDSLKQQISSSLSVVHQRQEVITGFWQELESKRSQVEQQQGTLNKAIQELSIRKQEWLQTQATLADSQAEVKAQRGILKVQENNASMIRSQLDSQEELFQQTSLVIESYGGSVSLESLAPEEVKRLEELPIEDLEKAIADWQNDFDKLANYVSAQEDELAALEGEIADLQSQIDQAADFDRMQFESDKEFAEEQYKLLEEGLSGQRRVMQERQSILTQQRGVLARRQGEGESDNPAQSLIPLLIQMETQKTRQEKSLQKMESQIEAVRGIVQQQQDLVNRQTVEHQQHYQEIETLETQLHERIRVVAELKGQLSIQEQILRPVQDVVDTLRQHLETAISDLNLVQPGQEQQKLVTELQQSIEALIS